MTGTSISGFRIDTRYRQTFLRRHVEEQMGWSSDDTWRASMRDVLALADLERELGSGRSREVIEKLRPVLNLENFFYWHLPNDQPVCIPVPVFPVGKPQECAPDLTRLILQLDQAQYGHSIVLTARTGSGKTVAARKAFCDCIVAGLGQSQPLLGGYLPCWVSVDARGTRDRNDKPFPQLIERLILRVCQLEEQPNAVRNTMTAGSLGPWLRESRLKLLLFFDLNAWDTEAREDVAKDLVRFLDEYQGIGHRAVVAYRSSAVDDRPLHLLQERDRFRLFDLNPVSTFEARAYLNRIRLLERQIDADRVGVQEPSDFDSVEQQTKQVVKLISRFKRSRGEESLISTPLLMHYCSLLSAKHIETVSNLSDLYEIGVKHFFERELMHPILASGQRYRDQKVLYAAMARLAVLMASSGSETTALFLERFEEALENPESGNPEDLLDSRDGWWPKSKEWRGCDWVSRRFERSDVDYLIEFSLLRRDGGKVRFLHDSFQYYFVAWALRYATGENLRRTWSSDVVAQLRSWPHVRPEVLEFLGGMISDVAFEGLLIELLAGPPDLQTALHLSALIRGASGNSEIARRLEAEAKRRSGWAGMRYPECFLGEIHEALISERDGACDQLAERIVERMRVEKRVWIRNRTPRRWDPVQVHQRHSEVTCLASWVDPEDPDEPWVLSGCKDGTIELWNPETLESRVFRGFKIRIGELHILDDKSIVACGDTYEQMLNGCKIEDIGQYNEVRRWKPFHADEEGEVILRHNGSLKILVQLDDGGVVSLGDDGTVRRWDSRHPERKDEELFRTEDEIATSEQLMENAVCVIYPRENYPFRANQDQISLNDGSVVSRSNDRTVRRLVPGQPLIDRRIASQDHQKTNCFKRLDDNFIISGGEDGAVRKWDPRQPEKEGEVIIQFGESVARLLQLDDGSIVALCGENIQRWNPRNPDNGVETIIRHHSWIRQIQVIDGSVVSGDHRGVVMRWDPRHPEQEGIRIISQNSYVNCLCGLKDSSIVSGCVAGHVHYWNPRQPSVGSRKIIQHEQPVKEIFELECGMVVSRHEDETLCFWDPNVGGEVIKTTGEFKVTFWRYCDGSSNLELSTGDDEVFEGRLRTCESTLNIKPAGFCKTNIELNEGTLVAFRSDGTVARVDPRDPQMAVDLIIRGDQTNTLDGEGTLTVCRSADKDELMWWGVDKTIRYWQGLGREVKGIGTTFWASAFCKQFEFLGHSKEFCALLESGELLFLVLEPSELPARNG